MTRRGALVVGLAALAALVGAAGLRVAARDVPLLAAAGSGSTVGAAEATGAAWGAFHVHSDSSHDGRIPATEMLAAATGIGLDFLVFAEHDSRPVHVAPAGDLVVVPGTELSTRYGHLIYLGYDSVPDAGPLRRGIGVADSLAARGAFTVLAHPVSPRRPWLGRLVGPGGLEIASTSDDARVAATPFVRILPALLALPLNRRLALAQLYRRDDRALRLWDRMDPGVVGLCGTDAHGWIDPAWNLRTWQVVLDPSHPAASAEDVVEALRSGAFFCVAGLLTTGPPGFSFRVVTDAGDPAAPGASAGNDRAVALEVTSPRASRSGDVEVPVTTVLLRDGREVVRTEETELRYERPAVGTWRVEVHMRIPGLLFGGRDVPVLYSNRIEVTEPPSIDP